MLFPGLIRNLWSETFKLEHFISAFRATGSPSKFSPSYRSYLESLSPFTATIHIEIRTNFRDLVRPVEPEGIYREDEELH